MLGAVLGAGDGILSQHVHRVHLSLKSSQSSGAEGQLETQQ